MSAKPDCELISFGTVIRTFTVINLLCFQFVLWNYSGSAMSRSVTLVKGKNNMIGISIGGGAPMCPVLYVVQVG